MTIGARLAECLTLHLRDGTAPRVPEGGAMIWAWFCDLSEGRTFHAAGPNPITYAEIDAYARLMRAPIGARHIEALRLMDRAFLADFARRMPGAVANLATAPAGPMTPGLFDAIFGK